MTANTIVLDANRTVSKNAAAVAAASLFIALMAQVAIPLPFTPVPFTMQTFAVYLVAAALGPRLGVLSVAAYLCEGACGLPVFSTGAAGVARLMGPTGGYLLGFVPAVFLSGALCGAKTGKLRALAAFAAGAVVFYALGLVQLARFMPAGLAVKAGLVPFVPGEIIKIFLAAGALPLADRISAKLH